MQVSYYCFLFYFWQAQQLLLAWKKTKILLALCEDCNTPSSSIEEIKHDIKYYTFNPFLEMSFFDSEKGSGLIIFENLSKHDLICASIFIPPPNKV